MSTTNYSDLAYRTVAGQSGQQVYNPTTGKAYGSPEQLATDLGVQSTQIDWSKIGTGTVNPGTGTSSANDVSNFSLTSPNGSGYNPGNTMDYIATQSAGWQSQIDTMQAQQAELLKQRQASQVDTVGLLNQENQAFGVNDMLSQMKSLTAEANAARDNLNAIQAEQNQAMLNEEGRKVSLSTIRGSQAIIQKQYDLRIASASATLSSKGLQISALQGNISQAKSFADQMVSALTYDAQQKVANLDFVFNYNQDLIKELGSKVTEGFKTQMALAQTQYDEQKADRTAVANLMIQYGNAGIQPTDSIEVASQKAAKQSAIDQQLARQKTQAEINASNRSGSTATPTANFYENVAQQEINGMTSSQDAYLVALKVYSDQYGEAMPYKEANALWSRVQQMKKTTSTTIALPFSFSAPKTTPAPKTGTSFFDKLFH